MNDVAPGRHELGIRIVIGASVSQTVGLVVRDAMRPVVVGIVLGCVGAFGLSRLMRTMLFGVRPFEPTIVAAVAVVFSVVTLAACDVPARRATALDPTHAAAIGMT